MLLLCCQLGLPLSFVAKETFCGLAVAFRKFRGVHFCDPLKMAAHNVSAGCAGRSCHVNGFFPCIYKFAYTTGNKRSWRALADRPALHDCLSVRHAPTGVMQRDRSYYWSVEVGQVYAGHPGGELTGKSRVRGLRDHPAIASDLALRLLHHAPSRQKVCAGGGDGIERTQNHQLERLLAMRRGTAMALAGPLLEGGFFIPSSSSLSATALLRSESFDA